MEDALKVDAPKIHAEGNVLGEKHLRRGDAPRAMREADVIVEDTIQTQTVDHAFLDMEAGRARYDGKMLTIEVSGQWLHEERRLVALALGLPLEKLRIIQPATGGAFGGREDISIQIYLGAAALKLKGKMICMRYSRSESTTVATNGIPSASITSSAQKKTARSSPRKLRSMWTRARTPQRASRSCAKRRAMPPVLTKFQMFGSMSSASLPITILAALCAVSARPKPRLPMRD